MARLAREVEEHVLPLHEVPEAVFVANVGDVDPNDLLEAVDVVEIPSVFRNQGVDQNHLRVGVCERSREVRADEAEATGDEHVLASKFFLQVGSDHKSVHPVGGSCVRPRAKIGCEGVRQVVTEDHHLAWQHGESSNARGFEITSARSRLRAPCASELARRPRRADAARSGEPRARVSTLTRLASDLPEAPRSSRRSCCPKRARLREPTLLRRTPEYQASSPGAQG